MRSLSIDTASFLYCFYFKSLTMGQRTFMRHTLSMKSKAMACRAIGTFPILVTRRAHGSSMMLTSQPLRSSSASTTKHGRRCCTALSHRNLFTSTAMMGIPPFSRGTGAYYSRPRYHQHCSLGSVACKLLVGNGERAVGLVFMLTSATPMTSKANDSVRHTKDSSKLAR